MPLVQTIDRTVEYPESDGKPMGETDLHIDWIIRIRDILKQRYRGQRVYVGSDMFVYCQEGNPVDMVVPDGFVVLDCDPHRRRTFKIWEEGKAPQVVFEVTSRGSKQVDEIFKPSIYARIGVREYFIYDPRRGVSQSAAAGIPARGGRLSKNPTGLERCVVQRGVRTPPLARRERARLQ